MTSYRTLSVLFCIVTSPVLSQTVTRYKQGLVDENVVYINQDQSGILWIGSEDGSITSYNGWEFKELPSREMTDTTFKSVKHITIANDYLLMATNNSIQLYKDDAYSTLYKGVIRTVATKGDSLLFVDRQKKLNVVLGRSVESLLLSQNIESILQVSGRTLLLNDSNQVFSLGSLDSNSLIHDFNKAEKFDFLGHTIFKSGERLIGVPNNLYAYVLNAIPGTLIQQTIVDQSRTRIWILAQGDLILIEPTAAVKLSKPLGLTHDEVNYIFEDFEENLWAGTSDGLYRVQKNKFQFVGSVQSGDRITAISKAWNDQLVVGTERGKLNIVKGMKLATDNILNSEAIESVNSLRYDTIENKLWLGSGYSELFSVVPNGDLKKTPHANRSWANATVQTFSEDKYLWISTRNKNYRIPNELITPVLKLLTMLDNQTILAVDAQANRSIVVLTSEGIARIQDGNIYYDTLDGVDLGNKIVTSFEIQEQQYWIGTWGHGIILINSQENSQRIISRIDGLNSDVVFNLKSINGDVYVGTPRGIDVVSTTKDSIMVRHLSDDITPTNQNSFYFDAESNLLWFGSNAKCYYYRIGSPFKRPSPVLIENATFYGDGFNDVILRPGKSMGPNVFRFGENNVELRFIGVSLSFPEAITYSTRLIGWDSTWTKPGKDRSVRYANLPPGEYRFEVIAISPEGVANVQGSSFQFIIKNSIWGDPRLILGAMFVLLLIGWAILKLLERRRILATHAKAKQEQEVMEQVRKNIARDFHDNIGNKLAGLKLSSNLMRLKLTEENQELSNLLAEIERSSQDLFERTKDFIWSIDPESDNLIEVFTYIKDFGERFFERTQFKFYSSLSQSKSFVQIPTGWSRQMVMIFKEAMTNTFKHSNGDSVTLQLEVNTNRFNFSYSDNGSFSGTKNISGRGLKNMVERANSISCQLTQNFTGSRVEVTLSGSLVA